MIGISHESASLLVIVGDANRRRRLGWTRRKLRLTTHSGGVLSRLHLVRMQFTFIDFARPPPSASKQLLGFTVCTLARCRRARTQNGPAHKSTATRLSITLGAERKLVARPDWPGASQSTANEAEGN